jgi:hypothetical protein
MFSAFMSEHCSLSTARFLRRIADCFVKQFDTGPLSSHDHFAINSSPENRMTYRRVRKCTALNDTAHTTAWESTFNRTFGSQNDVAYANYGPSNLQDTNNTYSYPNYADLFTEFTAATNIPYRLSAQAACAGSFSETTACYSAFKPIPELELPYADLTMAFLSFQGYYTEPVENPWFSAHSVFHRDSPLPMLRTTYSFDRPISSLACTEQHQFCTDSGQCSRLLGLNQMPEEMAKNLKLQPKQDQILNRMLYAAGGSNLPWIVWYLSTTSNPLLALNATATGMTTISSVLPDTQWQSEVESWHMLAMAHLQRLMVEYGTGQIAAQTKYLSPPQTDNERWLCENLMVNSTAYRSFSVLKLTILGIAASIIITLSSTIERIVSWLQLKTNRGIHAREMWLDHDMLGPQLWKKEIDEKNPALSRGSSATGRTYDSRRHELDMTSLQLYSEKLSRLTQKSSA